MDVSRRSIGFVVALLAWLVFASTPLAQEGAPPDECAADSSGGQSGDTSSRAAETLASGDDNPCRCLAQAIYFESRGQSPDIMLAVAGVILNRVTSKLFPESVCGVVHQGGEDGGCQFAWWCDGRSDLPREEEEWVKAVEIARAALDNPASDPSKGGYYFYSGDADMPWKLDRPVTTKIDQVRFYGLAPSEREQAAAAETEQAQ